MKQIIIVVSLSFLMACAPGGADSKRAELEGYKKKIEEYTEKLELLEAELEGESSADAEVTAVPVEIIKMVPEVFSRYFEVTGVMEAIKDANLSPELNGQIQEVLVDRGARVRKGQLLVKLNTEVTEKSIEEVKTNLELASMLYEKQKELWKQNIGSELQYLEAKNAKESLEARLATLEKQLEMANITAPFSGIIEDIIVKEGELASPGMPLLRLVNLSVMRVSARVSEAYIRSVQTGDQVQIRIDAYPDMKIMGKISRLGEVIDQQTRTFTLEVELDNPGKKLKPNMLTSVRIKDYEDKNALVVPSIILKQDFNGTFLFCVSKEEGSSKARKVYVESGITVQDLTRIESGLSPEDLVISKGYNLVGDGTPVRVVNLQY